MRGFYKFSQIVLRAVMPLWFHLETEGMEKLPQTGGYLFISNHRSMADPILVAMENPCAEFCFLAKREIFKKGFIGWLLRALGGVPIERGSGDLSPLQVLCDHLQKGGDVLIFPEGTRSKDGRLGRFKSGAALIAAQTGAPIVPACISFSGKLHFRSKILIRFGAPFTVERLPEGKPGLPELKQIREEMAAHVRALLPESDQQISSRQEETGAKGEEQE